MIMTVMMNKAELKQSGIIRTFFSCHEEKLFSLFLQYFLIFLKSSINLAYCFSVFCALSENSEISYRITVLGRSNHTAA
jgi:hypothetical protein